MGNSTKKQGNIVAILAMIFLFAMIAFVTNLFSPMAVILKNAFKVPEALAQVGNYGNFGAYLLMGVPAGLLIDKFGYKKTALAALVVGIVGLLIQWFSGSMGFVVYLIGAFISGLCMCMLNTVVNPMLNLLGGGGKTGNQLVQLLPFAFTCSWVASSATLPRQKCPMLLLHCSLPLPSSSSLL